MTESLLRQRLNVLRREGGAGPATSPTPPLTQKQRESKLREHLRTLDAPRRANRARVYGDADLARDLHGQRVGEGLIRVETDLPWDTVHGASRLDQGVEHALNFFAARSSPVNNAVFLDTETTGLAGGTGTVAFLLGIGRFSAQGLRIVQLFLTRFAGERDLLHQASACLNESDTLVSYNGKRFDHPLLAARCRLHGLDDPVAQHAHLDLLYPTRSAFRNQWVDCRLATAERHLLKFERRNDLPGWAVPSAWFDWVRRRDNRKLSGVVQHNLLDILSLVALLPLLQQAFQEPLTHRADIEAGVRHHLRLGNERAAFEHLVTHRPHLATRSLLQLARLARRQNDLALATKIWDELARRENAEATEQLAKYQEHNAGNIPAALTLAQRLTTLEPNAEAHQRRAARLAARLATRGEGIKRQSI